MKKIITILALSLGISYASAASCTDITRGLAKFHENSSVLALQRFLFDKGLLKATPNGYFGNATLAAVKAYQKSLGLEQVGNVGPATRAAIKKESCFGVVTVPISSLPSSNNPTVIAAPTFPSTPQGKRNAKRKEDIAVILQGLYHYFVDSRGVHSLAVSDTPQEMCVVNTSLVASTATSSNGSFTIVNPVSPCANFIDMSYLVPHYLKSIPRDPSIATTSAVIGYTITRSQYNDITIAAKNPEDGAIIKVTCNFNGFCKEIKYISTVTFSRPEIVTVNRNIFLRDASPRTPFILKGKNFTKKNTIKLFSLYNSKEYILGEYNSADYSTSTKSISIEGALFNQNIPCGTNCIQKLPLGDYMLSVVNEGGESNTTRVALRGFTTSTISTQVNGPIVPTTTGIRVGTITLSSTIPVSLKSLTLVSTTTAKNLPSKISNFVLKDSSDGSTISGGASGAFAFTDVSLFENQSKVYDVYIDTAEVMNVDAGFITYGGKFMISDTFAYVDMEVPIKEFSFTVSH